MIRERVLVVGNGMVGHQFVENLVAADKTQNFEISVFCEETRLAYDRVQLSSFFSGASADDLALTRLDDYLQHGIKVIIGDKITAIDTHLKTVVSESGKTFEYDKLVLATGSYPFVPPIPGREQPHCLVYRTIDDLLRIESSARQSQVGVVVGGGLLGLEAANALRNLGLNTHVVEFAPQLMAVQIDEGGGTLLRRKIEALGVSVHTSKATQEIINGECSRYRMIFSDGSHLETDMILFSAGIRPRDELARHSGLQVGKRGGIIINSACRTSDKSVYAIGECALWRDQIFGLVAPGYQMAKVVVSQLASIKTDNAGISLEQKQPASQPEKFSGADMSTKLKLMGIDVASIGDAHGKTQGAQSYIYNDEVAQVYKRLIISSDGKKLLGAVLVGDATIYSDLLQLKLNDIALPQSPETLILPSLSEETSAGIGVEALPETAQICSCFDVTKSHLCAAVQNGATDMAALKSTTKASTGCGGCGTLVKQILDKELSKLGVEINNYLCEHFSYSRRELADIVRIKKIKTFSQLLNACGKGDGCDICKPTVASILASFWNEYILKEEHLGLQDTNDNYLGNMQKNGTYSVVPRIPGGEITPAKLIVLGQVAEKFGLYTKITGGQRIDLFGAQLHELPAIWRILIDAGFETGHAYGKSLRTVKSCVGNTWCRYGVQDSVSMALAIENRYKGLRSPHKIKMAVSGCTRECAEAQSKDIGVIATENGWNLFVCGNGGMRPRHADLFATDLSDETLVKYIDRVLMFYVRTADRLQRTSVWLENLEGGLDYLRDVVIEDKLGIAKQLEDEMTAVAGKYQCEWRTTIESPEKLKRFRHFVNTDKTDEAVIFVPERGQRRPLRENDVISSKTITG